MKQLIIKKESIDENVLRWNSNTNRWQLTLSYVKALRDPFPYKNDAIIEQRIKQNSIRVYQYIVAHSHTVNRQVIDFLLNKTENGQRFLIDALTAQMEADMEYGYNDLMVRPVINAQTGQEGDRNNFRRNAISLECESIIDDSAAYFGFNICYMSPFPWRLFALARNYED